MLLTTLVPFFLNQIYTVGPPPTVVCTCAENWILYVPGLVTVNLEFETTVIPSLITGVSKVIEAEAPATKVWVVVSYQVPTVKLFTPLSA